MRIFSTCLLTGLLILYFIDAALSIDNLSIEMLTHNLVRFFSGFVFLGIWNWYRHRLKLKVSLYLILIFLVSDDIYDYIRNIDTLNFEMLLHDLFIVIWGAVSGYFFIKSCNKIHS